MNNPTKINITFTANDTSLVLEGRTAVGQRRMEVIGINEQTPANLGNLILEFIKPKA